MTKVRTCSEYQQLDIYINDISQSLTHYSWTYCDLDEVRVKILPIITIPRVLSDLKNILSKWEFEIISTDVLNKDIPIQDSDNIHFDTFLFYTNIYLYILYYLIEKDTRPFHDMIYDLYNNNDINGLQSLCSYFYASYLSVDNVQYIDKCHEGFRNIFNMMRAKISAFKIDNYEITSIMKDYVYIPDKKEMIINNLYREYTSQIFKLLEEKCVASLNTDIAYKLQNTRLLKLLRIYNSSSKIIIKDHGIVDRCFNFIVNCVSSKCITVGNMSLMFVSTFLFRKRIIKYKLLQKSIPFIEHYFNKLKYIYTNQSIEHILDYENKIINSA